MTRAALLLGRCLTLPPAQAASACPGFPALATALFTHDDYCTSLGVRKLCQDAGDA